MANGQKILHVAIGHVAFKFLNWDMTENYVPGPRYKLQEKQKNYIFKIKLHLQNRIKYTCQQYKTHRIWYISKICGFMLTWYILWCQKMENKRENSITSKP